MKKSNYEYKVGIESPTIRGIDKSRPWDLQKIIFENSNPNKTLLDIGCGTGVKLFPLCNQLKFVVGLDINLNLLNQASKNAIAHKIDNLIFVHGTAEKLPFPDNQFDLVTAMLAPINAAEIYRILKPTGLAILEKVGDHDKKELKKMFGKDDQGWRGYLYTDDADTPQKNSIEKEFKNAFSELTIKIGDWDTYYSMKDLIKLLEETPTVRNFNSSSDKPILDKIEQELITKDGIKITQNRLLIMAKK